jgi:hypothetical protein
MPGRLGPRFAVEAGFLILLAVGTGLADLRPRVIVIVMGIAWLLVALIELTADRISTTFPPWRRPVLLPGEEEADEAEAERVAPVPDRHSATVVAPVPENLAEPPPPPPAPEPASVEQPAAEAGDAVRLPEPVEEPEPEGLPAPHRLEPLQPRPRRRWFRRRERRDTGEPERTRDEAPPRHVRLLPPAAESSRAAREVAELFDAADRDDADEHRA